MSANREALSAGLDSNNHLTVTGQVLTVGLGVGALGAAIYLCEQANAQAPNLNSTPAKPRATATETDYSTIPQIADWMNGTHSIKYYSAFKTRNGETITPSQAGKIVDYQKLGKASTPEAAWQLLVDSPVVYMDDDNQAAFFGVGDNGVIKIKYSDLQNLKIVLAPSGPYANGGQDTKTPSLTALREVYTAHQTVLLGLVTPSFYTDNGYSADGMSPAIASFAQGNPNANAAKYVATKAVDLKALEFTQLDSIFVPRGN